MTTTKLTLYKRALRVLGERSIASLTEDRKPRRVLDEAWDDGVVDYCLRRDKWNFATRTQLLEASTSIEPDFGFQYAFEKGSDWMRTVAIATDENFNNPLTRYDDETNILYCDHEQIYVKFVSNDSEYGGDYSLWDDEFVDYVGTYLASQICKPLTQKDFDPKILKESLRIASSKNTTDRAPRIAPLGTFASARRGGRGHYLAAGNFRI